VDQLAQWGPPSLTPGGETPSRPSATIFLVAGDKAGNWQRWYTRAIQLADERFAEHLIALKENER
jgi:hypothetical protein